MNTCGGCTKAWTGTQPCHCSACHETFSGVTTFDAHRQANAGRGKCRKPSRMGLVQNEKGMWCTPQASQEEEVNDEISNLP